MDTSSFSQEQYDQIYPPGIDHHYWTEARNIIIMRQVRKLRRTEKDLILDIGCGCGVVTRYLRQHGFNAVGCDIGEPPRLNDGMASYLYVGVAADKLPYSVRTATRILLLLDVLEHIAEPAAFIHILETAFPNNRHIIITVPARRELWSNFDVFCGHFRRYDLPILPTLFEGARCKLLTARYLFRLLYPPALLLARFGKRRTRVRPPARWTRWPYRLIANLLAVEAWFIPPTVPGTSILAVLRMLPGSDAMGFHNGGDPASSNAASGGR